MTNALALQLSTERKQLQDELQSPPLPAAPSAQASGAETVSFTQALGDAVRAVDGQNQQAGKLMADVDAGRSDDLVGAMLQSQEAGLSFSMLMQVRNKVVGAVDDLLKMQI